MKEEDYRCPILPLCLDIDVRALDIVRLNVGFAVIEILYNFYDCFMRLRIFQGLIFGVTIATVDHIPSIMYVLYNHTDIYMVRALGFEPRTYWLKASYSTN